MPSPPLSIVQSISPRVAVLSSDGVIQACEANGCRGLEELLRPWEGSTDRGGCPPADRQDSRVLTRSVDPLLHADTYDTSDIPIAVRTVRPGLSESSNGSAGSRDGRRHDQQLCRGKKARSVDPCAYGRKQAADS